MVNCDLKKNESSSKCLNWKKESAKLFKDSLKCDEYKPKRTQAQYDKICGKVKLRAEKINEKINLSIEELEYVRPIFRMSYGDEYSMSRILTDRCAHEPKKCPKELKDEIIKELEREKKQRTGILWIYDRDEDTTMLERAKKDIKKTQEQIDILK